MANAIKRNTLILLDANWTNKNDAVRFIKHAAPIIITFYLLALLTMTIGQNLPNTATYNSIINDITNPNRFDYFGSLGFTILFLHGMLMAFRLDIKSVRFLSFLTLSVSAAALILSLGVMSAQITLFFIFNDFPLWKITLVSMWLILVLSTLLFINFVLWTAVELSFPQDRNNRLSGILKQFDRPFLFSVSLLGFVINALLLVAYTG